MSDTQVERAIRHTIHELLEMGWDRPERVQQKNVALDAGIAALAHLATTGSMSKQMREDALKVMWLARQDPLDEEI